MGTSSPLLDRVRAACQRKGYSYRTEQTYTRWIVRHVKYHDTTNTTTPHIPVTWRKPMSGRTSPISPRSETSQLRHRTRPSTP